MMKKIISLILALALILSLTTALADPTEIDGTGKRDITINRAGLNEDPAVLVEEGISPTTGRRLDEISVPNSFLGAAVTYTYTPVMVMVSNAGGGGEVNVKGNPETAPINGSYADVIYEAIQATDNGRGSLSRLTVIYSDTIPDYVGFVRSTRLTHARLRQEWDSVFLTSGYHAADIPDEWKKLGVTNPDSGDRTAKDPGYVYVGQNTNKIYTKGYYYAISGIKDANSKVFLLAKQMLDLYPTAQKNGHKPANHTWKFTDEIPEGGDTAEIVWVEFGSDNTNSRLEYDEETNSYFRYIKTDNGEDVLYREQQLVNPEVKKVKSGSSVTKKLVCEDRVFGEAITFNNVIVQAIDMNWRGAERPDPVLTGTGNADYFMGGKHYEGVWERQDINDRTVFYDKNGNEIEMQRGRTLIILMDYSSGKRSVRYE